ncbi:MAG: hypothetical protein ACTSWW_10350 [Promethearchaeota archaeon]
MIIRSHKGYKAKSLLLILLTLSPFTFLGIYIGNTVQMFDEMVAFTYLSPPDPATFQTANYSRLAEMAEFYDARYEEFHIPLNFSTSTIFTDKNCTEVDRYAYSDNGGQWTGLAVTGYVFKYVAAIQENNATLKADALRVVRKLVHGISMMLAVPNGGLGPNYSGILARGWANPANKDIAQFYFDDNDQHRNGTGIYSDWRWRCYTSLDEYSGIYSGLALILKYVQEPDVQALVTLMIDQLANYMIQTNFIGIDWHGGPTGVDQKVIFFQRGTWVCLLLKMAAIALPDKYERIYYRYAVEEYYAYWSKEGSSQESVSNYYAFAFGTHVQFALLLLEDSLENPALYELFLQIYLENMWHFTANHRNPFYNLANLLITAEVGDDTLLERDVEDQLMRYDCEYHFPDRYLGHAEIPEDEYVPVDNVDQLFSFFATDPYGSIYRPIFSEAKENAVFYQKPLTVEYMNGDIFIWESNPFVEREPRIMPTYELPGFSFTCAYWMGRAFGSLQPSGVREAL